MVIRNNRQPLGGQMQLVQEDFIRFDSPSHMLTCWDWLTFDQRHRVGSGRTGSLCSADERVMPIHGHGNVCEFAVE